MAGYRPRRFSHRWNEGAPAYVLDVLDNKGASADRYTVLIAGKFLYHVKRDGSTAVGPDQLSNTYVSYLAMSGAPTHPQGVSMWGELEAHQAASYRYRCKHHRIKWLDLPEHIRAHVIARCADEKEEN